VVHTQARTAQVEPQGSNNERNGAQCAPVFPFETLTGYRYGHAQINATQATRQKRHHYLVTKNHLMTQTAQRVAEGSDDRTRWARPSEGAGEKGGCGRAANLGGRFTVSISKQQVPPERRAVLGILFILLMISAAASSRRPLWRACGEHSVMAMRNLSSFLFVFSTSEAIYVVITVLTSTSQPIKN